MAPDMRKTACILFVTALLTLPATLEAQTRFLRQPTVSATEIAFVHANDIWVVRRGASDARRLTSAEGAETEPAFSPDGRWIAFTGEYGGNQDVYLVEACRRAARAPHLAPLGRRGPGMDAGWGHPLSVRTRSRAHPPVDVLYRRSGGWPA